MKKPKKPKFKSLPKKPKANASIQTLENYKKRCEEVVRENNKRVADYNKAIDAYNSEKKKREKLRSAVPEKVTAKMKS